MEVGFSQRGLKVQEELQLLGVISASRISDEELFGRAGGIGLMPIILLILTFMNRVQS